MDDNMEFQTCDHNFSTVCVVPGVCHVGEPIHFDSLSDAVKVICNSDQCKEGSFMHKVCFDQWQESVLTFLRSTGRARSWSEKQRLQNLWTKKGYDLAYKACCCKCGKGHLRKDLDWIPPPEVTDDIAKKKKNRKKKNDKPALAVSRSINQNKPGQGVPIPRMRSSSISSTSSGSPANYAIPECPQSPSYTGNKPNYRERHNSGNLFPRRQDYSSFNMLPRHKINSYHIRMEDERCQGNDEIRGFILSLFVANKTNCISCVFCDNVMNIFDSYPLIDGTFFISPRQHNATSLQTNSSTHAFYLNAICMTCLEGWNSIFCRCCHSRWSGSELILGTMYSYDVIAAKPCCVVRLKCNNCTEMIRLPENRYLYFSDYSHIVPCSNCGVADFHFVKPVSWFSCS